MVTVVIKGQRSANSLGFKSTFPSIKMKYSTLIFPPNSLGSFHIKFLPNWKMRCNRAFICWFSILTLRPMERKPGIPRDANCLWENLDPLSKAKVQDPSKETHNVTFLTFLSVCYFLYTRRGRWEPWDLYFSFHIKLFHNYPTTG